MDKIEEQRTDCIAEPAQTQELAHVRHAFWRDTVVVVLVLAGFFDALSGKPIHGLFLIAVGIALLWDSRRPTSLARATDDPPDPTDVIQGSQRTTSGNRWVRPVLLLAGAAASVVVVALTPRFSWPTTLIIITVGGAVLVGAWKNGDGRPSPHEELSRRGTTLWILALVAGGLWELAALLLQPTLILTSYDNPTISALSDPYLATHLWRGLGLLVWLGVGWRLVRR